LQIPDRLYSHEKINGLCKCNGIFLQFPASRISRALPVFTMAEAPVPVEHQRTVTMPPDGFLKRTAVVEHTLVDRYSEVFLPQFMGGFFKGQIVQKIILDRNVDFRKMGENAGPGNC